jgi:DNA-binding transcriptional ArsR family regulator
MVKLESAADLDDVFRALANDVRREIVVRLAAGETPVAEVAAGFDVSAPAISRHLRILESAGVVARRRHGRRHLVRLERTALDPAAGWLAAHGARWGQAFDALARRLGDTPGEER